MFDLRSNHCWNAVGGALRGMVGPAGGAPPGAGNATGFMSLFPYPIAHWVGSTENEVLGYVGHHIPPGRAFAMGWEYWHPEATLARQGHMVVAWRSQEQVGGG
eukprot:Hpha_TRINITY_DN32586_c0_g1::TRINITY_DN32586_c0_g1_i1::g.24445::m.24445